MRAQGCAEAVEEREVGLTAIAAPVWGAGGELAAIVALQGPTSRFDADGDRKPRCRSCSSARSSISVALGWHGP